MWWLKKTETEFKVNRRLSKMAVKDIEIIGQCENDCCCCSVAKSCLTLCNPMDCSTLVPLSSTVSQSFLKFMSIESVNVSNHLILPCPLLLLPSIFPSIKVFSNELSLRMRWQSIGASEEQFFSEYSRLISSRTDCFDLLAAQGNFKSLLQNHNSKASILW